MFILKIFLDISTHVSVVAQFFFSMIQEFLVCFKSQVKVGIYLPCLNYWGQVKLFLLIWPNSKYLGQEF